MADKEKDDDMYKGDLGDLLSSGFERKEQLNPAPPPPSPVTPSPRKPVLLQNETKHKMTFKEIILEIIVKVLVVITVLAMFAWYTFHAFKP